MKAHDLYITCHLASLYEKIGNFVNRRNSYIYRLGECCKTKSLAVFVSCLSLCASSTQLNHQRVVGFSKYSIGTSTQKYSIVSHVFLQECIQPELLYVPKLRLNVVCGCWAQCRLMSHDALWCLTLAVSLVHTVHSDNGGVAFNQPHTQPFR